MFAKKSKTVTIEGIELVVTELTASKARQIQQLTDEWDGTRKAFLEMVRKPDGSAFFANDSEVDDLPTSIVQKLGDAIKALNEVKN